MFRRTNQLPTDPQYRPARFVKEIHGHRICSPQQRYIYLVGHFGVHIPIHKDVLFAQEDAHTVIVLGGEPVGAWAEFSVCRPLA